MPSDTLPFVCSNCSKRFGFGDDPALLNIVAALPFFNEKTPCCGAVISGKVIRRDDGSVELDLINSVKEDHAE